MKRSLYFVIICIVVTFLLSIGLVNEKPEKYDYERENPNALISGENIAGTVYASYPENTPGLGWIL